MFPQYDSLPYPVGGKRRTMVDHYITWVSDVRCSICLDTHLSAGTSSLEGPAINDQGCRSVLGRCRCADNKCWCAEQGLQPLQPVLLRVEKLSLCFQQLLLSFEQVPPCVKQVLFFFLIFAMAFWPGAALRRVAGAKLCRAGGSTSVFHYGTQSEPGLALLVITGWSKGLCGISTQNNSGGDQL